MWVKMKKGLFPLLVSAMLLLAVTSNALEAQASLPRIDGAKVLAIVFNDFWDSQYLDVVNVLKAQGAIVHNASYDKNTVYGSELGTPVTPDLSFTEVNVSGFEAFHIPGGICFLDGGGDPIKDPRNETLFNLIRDANEEALILSAICASPVVLAKSYVVEGKRGTGHEPTVRQPWEEAGGIYVNDGIKAMRDGNIITGNHGYEAELSELLVPAIAERMSTPVGGVQSPVDKLGLLTPYIILVSTIILVMVATAAFVKYKKMHTRNRCAM